MQTPIELTQSKQCILLALLPTLLSRFRGRHLWKLTRVNLDAEKTLLQQNLYELSCSSASSIFTWKNFKYLKKHELFHPVAADFSVAFEYSSQTSRIFKVYKTLIAQKVYVPSFVSMYFSNRNNFTYNKKGFPTGQISTFSQMKWKVTFWKQFSIDFRAVKNRCFFKRIPTMQAKFFKTIFAKNSFVSQMQKILQTQKFPTLTVKIPKTQVWKHACVWKI